MTDIDLYGSTVKYHPYRTAEVVNRILQIDSGSKEIEDLRRTLCYMAGRRTIDNHECYTVTNEGHTLYFQFSDFKMYVGFGLVNKEITS